MTGDLDELTYDCEDDGVLVRKQLERVILARGVWATVMFLFQELDRETGAFRAPKIAVVRFQKWRGGYRKQSAFTLSGGAQVRELTAVLSAWGEKMRSMGATDEDPDLDADEQGAEA